MTNWFLLLGENCDGVYFPNLVSYGILWTGKSTAGSWLYLMLQSSFGIDPVLIAQKSKTHPLYG